MGLLDKFSKKEKDKVSSVSRWEHSFFGGYYRTLSDYPEVRISDEIEFTHASLNLPYYMKEKLLRIFLSKTKKHNLVKTLMQGATQSKIETFWNGVSIKNTISNKSKLDVINKLMTFSEEKEFAPMFSHYKNFIIQSEMYYTIPDEKDNEKLKQLEQKEEDKRNKENKKADEEEEELKKEKDALNKSRESENGYSESKPEESDAEGEDEESEENDGENGEGEESESESEESDGGDGDGESEDGEKSEESDGGAAEAEAELSKEPTQGLYSYSKFNSSVKLGKPTQEQIDAINRLHQAALQDVREYELKQFMSNLSGFDGTTQTKIETSNGYDTNFSYEETKVAENLLKMLDISFDNEKDIVKNLRIGKLDIAKIAEVPAGNISIYKQEVENQITKPFSVAILCDESGSMEGEKLTKQLSIVKSLYLAFSDIIPQDKLYVYGHTGSYQPTLYVYHDPHNPNFTTTIDKMKRHSHSSNYDGPIIEEVYKQIRQMTDDRIIFIVLSDGQPAGNNYGGPADIKKMKQIIEKCKRDDFVTIGVGIQYFIHKDLYNYSTVVNNLSEMAKKVSHIVNHVVKSEFQ